MQAIRVFTISSIICAAIFIAGAALAADKSLTKAQLEKLLIGHTALFEDGARAIYKTSGSYEYRSGPNVSRGQYAIGNGNVCAQFQTGSRGDRYVKSGNSYVLINQGGRRFPVKFK